jgi:hypothetical protein
VVEALKQPLKEAGLSYYFAPQEHADDANTRWMTCDLIVLNGEEHHSFSFPFNQSDPQKIGSALTYAKRYLLTTVFNVIAEEDDDGNAANGNTTKPVAKKKPTVMTDAPRPNFF